jgi:hypothetical protein
MSPVCTITEGFFIYCLIAVILGEAKNLVSFPTKERFFEIEPQKSILI